LSRAVKVNHQEVNAGRDGGKPGNGDHSSHYARNGVPSGSS
jgi:hypothetical protein